MSHIIDCEYSTWEAKCIVLLYLRRKCKLSDKSRKNRFWVRDIFKKWKELGAHNNLIGKMRLGDHSKFYNCLRMSPICFDQLLRKIAPKLHKTTIFRETIELSEMLEVTLRYLASGDSMVSVSYTFRLGTSTVSNIISKTCEAIWYDLQTEVFPVLNEENWLKISADFYRRWNFPHCIGSIDGKHVVIQAPPNSGPTFFNYKGDHSIILMALCDAQYNFTYVDIGAAGRQSDLSVLRQTEFGRRLFEHQLGISPPAPLIDGEESISYHIVGDEAFPLMLNLMRPYPGRYLDNNKRIYNYRLSRARRVIENAFGILATKWRIFRKPIIAKVETVEKIIQAAVCLHNYLNKVDAEYITHLAVDSEDSEGLVKEAMWRNDASENLIDVHHIGGIITVKVQQKCVIV